MALDRKSSIDSEPRTLTVDQMQFARDAAISVVKTRGIEAALRIFTEGLQPVVCGVENEEHEAIDFDDEYGYFTNNQVQQTSNNRQISTAPF